MNFIIPSHDYQTGTKVSSLSETLPYTTAMNIIESFYNDFVVKAQAEYEFFKIEKIWNYIFSGIIDALGEKEGLELLLLYRTELGESEKDTEKINSLDDLIKVVENRKFLPKRLFFAIKRFHRWFKLNNDFDFRYGSPC
jgi:hypothetical protein